MSFETKNFEITVQFSLCFSPYAFVPQQGYQQQNNFQPYNGYPQQQQQGNQYYNNNGYYNQV